jgi:hypothetical protein
LRYPLQKVGRDSFKPIIGERCSSGADNIFDFLAVRSPAGGQPDAGGVRRLGQAQAVVMVRARSEIGGGRRCRAWCC